MKDNPAAFDLSVIVPCFNEEGNIPLLLERTQKTLSEAGINGEIILVDDASSDRTAELIRAAEAERPNVRGCFHKVNQGIVGGWRTGLAASSGKYVVTIDADLQYQPEDIAVLFKAMDPALCDLVQGWRRFSSENHRIRYILSVGLSGMLNVLFGMRLKDIKSGFVLYKKEVFEDILTYKKDYLVFQHFITIAADAKGYRVRQVPVKFERRYAGESFITRPIRFSLKVLQDLPKALAEYRFGK